MPPPIPVPPPPPDPPPEPIRPAGSNVLVGTTGWLVAAVAVALLVYVRVTAPAGGVEAVPVTPGESPLLAGVRRVAVKVDATGAPAADPAEIDRRVRAALPGVAVGDGGGADAAVVVRVVALPLAGGEVGVHVQTGVVRSVVAAGPVRGNAVVWEAVGLEVGAADDVAAKAAAFAERHARQLAAVLAGPRP